MTAKYLYIDDETRPSIASYVEAVQGAGDDLVIDAEEPKPFDKQVQRLAANLGQYDGLILDWRLNEKANADGERAQFRAAALAQEIRTREAEGILQGIPIVLWSTYERLANSFNKDDTSHDLFDVRYYKERIAYEPNLVRVELLSLAQGYKVIGRTPRITDMLAVDADDGNLLDSRILSRFAHTSERIPVHEYARFILKEIILMPGPLLCEERLASRLGVDINNSPDWSILLARLPPDAEYRGVFHEAWGRWWALMIEQRWWVTLDDQIPPLSTLPAEYRVDMLKNHFGLEGLVAANPIEESYSSYFRTICEYTRKPLDPVDGVVIAGKESLPWQDKKYISLDVALERRGEAVGLYPHPTEVARVREIRRRRSGNA